MKKLFKIYFTILLVLGAVSSCTDLSEDLYSEILQDKYFQTQEEVISAIAPVYGNMRVFTNDMWDLNTHCTDQTLIPTRALGHWYDGGHWQRVHEHTWTPETPQINGAWGFNYTLINNSNKVIYQLESLQDMDADLKALFAAELKMIRGFGYYNLIDFFGNVPKVTSWVVEDETPPTTPRAEVFNFIVNDIETNVEKLSDKVDNTTYGRFNKYAGYAMLAKFYLNSQEWTGTAKWDKVIEYCDKIISSGKYSLSANIFDNFLIKNEGSKENIFVIPYDEVYTNAWGTNFTLFWRGMHYAHQYTYGTSMGPWNGFCALPGFIHSFDADDKRATGWLRGQQYSSTGEPLKGSQESNGKLLNLTVDFINIYNPTDGVTYNHQLALEFMGARFAKYQYGPIQGVSMGNDFVVYRYADILMMKAEALMRKNGGNATAAAVELVNQVRARSVSNPAKLYTTATLTTDALLAERGWEFNGEAMRRNDLIRFGKFIKGTWQFANRSAETPARKLFPIPQPQIAANPDLTQNPGY